MRQHKTSKDKRATYIYYTEDGHKTILVPGKDGVTEADIHTLHEFDDAEYRQHRRETEKHRSIEAAIEENAEQFPSSFNLEAAALQNIENANLHEAINSLLPQQKALIHKVFFEGCSLESIAREEGVSGQAIGNRLKKIIDKLQKVLK
ncbi:sigma-70 family RNA polymerase sigma factor [Acetanaerobacterium elongatum]|uniref:RNA polymerase sigma factor, sigma-70 family n=1 Tax=Acetanaerobacterium elongatum TaxID=258515 RepID=A0A1G9YC90_9FIRM|nr:sigma-70 family RNA polymerase sigma factor [Acetanaerobacterium elongatum]SDN06680.1 RNA polymerase sigma factor, sigma-70 family [Acetanaerobacterium elongatum]